MSGERERAVECIASALHREAYRGACGAFVNASQGDREYFTSRARGLLDDLRALGLVAIDLALVVAVSEAQPEILRFALADAVLAQLRGER